MTVANVAPTVDLTGAATADEGQTKTYTYTVTDPGDDSGPAVVESCGANGDRTDTAAASSFECTFPDGPASSTVKVTANDGDATDNVGSDEIDVAVANVAPTVHLTGADTASEGSTHTYSFTVTDPGVDEFVASAGYPDCDAGASDNGSLVGGTYQATAAGGSFDCFFADGPATADVKMKVADSDGLSGADSESVRVVSVANVAPTVVLTGAATADEGQTKTYTYTVTDPGSDPAPAVDESCGGNGTRINTAAANSFECTFPDGPASSTVKVTADDGDSTNNTGSDSIEVSVANVAPTVDLTGADTADEGQTKTYTYTVTDPGNDPSPAIDESCGGNGTRINTAAANSFECTFPDGPASSTVKVTADDGDPSHNVGSDEIEVSVANVAPTVDLTGADTANEGQTKTYTYTVTDPGTDPSPAITESCGSNGDLTDTAASNSFECTFPDGPASSTVKVTADDGDPTNNTGSDEIDATVANVAPTVDLAGADTANEGQTKTYTYTVTDPGSDPATVTESCGGNGTRTDTAASHSFECTFPDGPASSTVNVTADDGDPTNNTGSDEIDVTVANVAPTVDLTGADTANEGQTKTYTYTVSDPGTDPSPTITESCGTNGDLTDTAASNSFECTFPDGPASSTVKVTADDGDPTNNLGSDSIVVAVANVAPIVHLSGASAADEGQTKTYTYTVSDPGSDPSPTVTESCGTNGTRTDTAASNSFECVFPDGPASSTVEVTADDGDSSNHVGSDEIAVTVANVAPTADLGNNGPKPEGSPVTVSFSNSADPSSGDVAAGFRYGFACTASTALPTTYAAAGTATSKDCTFLDNGTYVVKGRIFDRNNGYRDYDTSVTVTNVAPTITSFTGTNALAGPLVFAPSTFKTDFTDPGTPDTHKADFTWASGAPLTQAVSPFVTGQKVDHTFAAGCNRTATVKVTDDDGNSDTKSTSVNVGTGTWLPPLADQPVSDKLRNGQVLPVKVKITDCNGVAVTGLTPVIQLLKGDLTSVNDDGAEVITIASVSAADTGTTMRESSGSYMYNLRVNVASAELNQDFTIIVSPYGTGSPQSMRHVIVATK